MNTRMFPLVRATVAAIILAVLQTYTIIAEAHMALPMSGLVIDSNGHPMDQVAVSVTTATNHGADTITVFTDKAGAFNLPAPVALMNFENPPVVARKQGYEQVRKLSEFTGDYAALLVTLTVSAAPNQANLTTPFNHGVPLLSTPRTVIREYKTPGPNTGSNALLVGTPPKLWIYVGGTEESNIAIELETEQPPRYARQMFGSVSMRPQILQRDPSGDLWVNAYMDKFVGLFDPDKEVWIKKWELKNETSNPIAVNRLSAGYQQEVLTDDQGRIWFIDIKGNSLGCFLPESGDTELIPIPEVTGLGSIQNTEHIDLFMNSDGKQVWFSLQEKGVLRMIDSRTQAVNIIPLHGVVTELKLIAFSHKDVLLASMPDTEQLLEYDTRTGEQLLHELPHGTDKIQATTFDPVRKVVWIAIGRGDLIYRFDPRQKSFAVLQLPSQATFIRTIAVDRTSGLLIASYADERDKTKNSGMVLTIDPGDGVFQARPGIQSR